MVLRLAKLHVSPSQLPAINKAMKELADTRVLVGVPIETTKRTAEPITNAAIAYIQENGAPEAHIPPRPFLFPTVRTMKPVIINYLRRAGKNALAGDLDKAIKTLEMLGLAAQSAVRMKIINGPFVPLAESTVRGRIARRASSSYRAKKSVQLDANLAAGLAPQTGMFRPLIDTGSLLASITYVLRRKSTGVDIAAGKQRPFRGTNAVKTTNTTVTPTQAPTGGLG